MIEAAALPVQLARVPDFLLGAAQVRPSMREIQLGGRVERLEPRVMQALVALAEAKGAVVSRDDLIARCWGGVVVGEDAVNRVMVKIRRLAELDGGRSFALETIPRVGYRLRATPPAAEPLPPPSAAGRAGTPVRAWLEAARRRRRALAVVAGLIVAAAAAGLGWGGGGRPKVYEIESVEIVAQTTKKEWQPAISPDGRLIVYAASERDDEPTDLFMRVLPAGEEQRLTDTPGLSEGAPVFSPAGDRLAYTLTPQPSGTTLAQISEPCRILVRDVRNGLERQVGACTAATYFVPWLAWTPDGRGLLYTDSEESGPDRIRLLDIASGRSEPFGPQAPDGTYGDMNLAMSPDGRRLAFLRDGGEAQGAYVFELATGKLQRVVRGVPAAHIAWSPDSRSLFAVLAYPLRTELRAYALDGRELRRYAVGASTVRRPFTAHGLLAFESQSHAENLVRAGADGPVVITNGDQVDRGADFSGGGALAFVSRQSDFWLYVQRPGEEPRRAAALTELHPIGVRWSPDGREIVFAGREDGRSGVYVIDVLSGAVRRIPLGFDGQVGNPAWAPDGRSLIFTGSSPEGTRLYRFDLASGGPALPISDYGWVEGIETAEGLFARRLDGPGVWRLGEGREPELVLPELVTHVDGQTAWASRREWAVSGGFVYGLDSAVPRETRIVARPLDGGPPVVVASAPGFAGSLAVDPRTGEVIYSVVTKDDIDVGVMRLAEK